MWWIAHVANMEKFKFDIRHFSHMEYIIHICITFATHVRDITVDVYFKFINVHIYGMLMAYGTNVLCKSYLI